MSDDNKAPGVVKLNVLDLRVFVPGEVQMIAVHMRRVAKGFETVMVFDGQPILGPTIECADPIDPRWFDAPIQSTASN